MISRPPIVLNDQRIDHGRRRPARFAQFREDVRLLQLALVIVLAERVEKLGGLVQRRGIHGLRGAQPACTFAKHQNRAAQNSVFAHQVFDGADIVFLS